ncbi:MAG: ferrochelatase [Acidobacteriaceae bacterium]|nr:ferrochelatase [Acidobacteriaceae bacterium]MBV9498089.1 ferrochelatase [Acidobacteriaceae bacterium]
MYDAILIVSFGGPEQLAEVLPFLENVTRGRSVPRERLLEVAEHYYHFGGKSPINDQCRELIAAVRAELNREGIPLPIYWGNRNWHPFLTDTLRSMREADVKHALAFVTSAYSSYSGCRQYRENIAVAQAEVGLGVPSVDKLRVFYNHPSFIEATTDRVRQALAQFSEKERASLQLVATAHSIPCSMAESSDYETQLRETARLVNEAAGSGNWSLVYQSRSGPPSQPWLGPDILDHLRHLNEEGVRNVLLAPIGFLSDHLEVLYDLDVEAAALTRELGMKLVRAETVGTHPAFVRMIRQLIAERIFLNEPKLAMGSFGPKQDFCALDCCPAPQPSGKPRVSADPIVLQRS